MRTTTSESLDPSLWAGDGGATGGLAGHCGWAGDGGAPGWLAGHCGWVGEYMKGWGGGGGGGKPGTGEL